MAEQETTTWPELAEGIFANLTGRGAEITYEFDHLEVHIPSGASSSAPQAPWKINGTLRIRTQDGSTGQNGA